MNTPHTEAQRRAVEALRKKFGSTELLDSLPIGVKCCDKDGTLLAFNKFASELWGWQPALGESGLDGGPRLRSLAGNVLPPELAPAGEVLRQREPVRNRRIIVERPDSTRRTLLVNADPLFADDGVLAGVVECFQDVTELRQASEALERDNESLDDFFENAAIGLHIVACDGTILRANKAELRLLGYSADEYVGRHISEFHADLPVIQNILTKLTRGEVLDRYPARLRAKDGSIRHVRITSNAQFRKGEFVSTRCFTYDVTESEERVREGEHRFREVLGALPAATYTTDAEGKITFYNDAAAKMAGREPKIGSDEWCVNWRLFWPDGSPMPHSECPMAIALRERRPVRGVEAIAERPDGSRVRFIPYPTPLFDEHGRLTGAVNMMIDITDRHAAEVQSAKLAAIVSCSNDAIIGKTLEGVVTSWNDAAQRIFGYTADEMIGAPITRIIPPDLQEEERGILAQLRRGLRIEHYETVRLTKDGRRLDISLTVSPVRDKSDKLIGASNVSRDITERKQAQKLQQLLVDELNHRVKNTLATVQSIANQTVHLAKSPSEFATGFSGRLQALAQAHTLLTHSSWQGAEVQALIRDQLLLGGIEDPRIVYSGPSATLSAQAALHLALLLHELGTNARKYGALSVPNGRLTVQWTVRTNGGRNLLLQWKEQVGAAVTAPSTRGFGMTLIEQSLIAHGGEATLQYEASGLTCDIRLPLPEDSASRLGAYSTLSGIPSPADTADHTRNNLRSTRVLVVEDEPLVAMDVIATLTEAGCEVVGPAATLERAKTLIAQGELDVALLDANLGGHRVDELAAALSKRRLPFCFITGYGRDGLPEAFRQAPMIAKPFTHNQVLDMVAALVTQSGKVVAFRQKVR